MLFAVRSMNFEWEFVTIASTKHLLTKEQHVVLIYNARDRHVLVIDHFYIVQNNSIDYHTRCQGRDSWG